MRPSATSGPYRNLRVILATKPADLPVEAPKRFELVINLKTAKQIGVTISPDVVARASWLIK
jgi:putative tryptophan/tyrosine transport system substrate-binding protein